MGAKYMFCLCLFVWIAEAHFESKVFNVKDYGAIADGKTDNSATFLKAWSEACNWNGSARILIPNETYILNPVMFSGPCKGLMNFTIKGILKAPTDPYLFGDDWINFRYVNNLTVSGGGTLDGQGYLAWPLNECSKNSNCPTLPATMVFDFITNSHVHDLRSIDSKHSHFVIYACQNMTFTELALQAPRDSPNTDGIKIGMSNGINITRVRIGTGDDCIAILSGSKKIWISDVFCGPGHGISVGSLGQNDGEEDVEDIVVKNCTFIGTLDGVRIKTWASPLNQTLNASNFVYENLFMINVEHPINIDQEYCPYPPCKKTEVASNVQIRNVTFKNILGSSSTGVGVDLKCSNYKPCQDIKVEDINLWPHGGRGNLSNFCYYANGASYGEQIPPSCI
ncbi:exopolygalacturonase-like [Gastrolobium bilobum]|uniref:exopolygalacturonase-like n=1 Tax=Gastrolobium bilobum TaxID=150636 RepID=UPI002AB3062A|nr:exopolygalacturonase-like [Gastrolobium bilobum]